MKITLDGVSRGQKETKYGVKEQIGVKIVETTIKDVNGAEIQVNDRWLNSFKTAGTEGWEKGSVVSVNVVEKDGKYLNFEPVQGVDTSELEDRLKKLEDKVFGAVPVENTDQGEDSF